MSKQINLINPSFRKKRELFGALMLVEVLGVLIVVLLAVYGYEYKQLQALAREQKNNELLLEQERTRLAQVAAEYAPRAKDANLEKQLHRLELQLKGEEAVLEALTSGSLGNTRGYADYLRAFARQTVSGLWLTSFTIVGNGAELALAGRTLKPELVPAYIQRLNQETSLQGRSFVALEMRLPKTDGAASDKPAPPPAFLEFRLSSSPLEGLK